MTDGEKLTFIVEKALEITEAVIVHGHKPTTTDNFAEDRELIRQYRVELGLIKSKELESSIKNPIMDEFDKTLKLLHESTHDKNIREAIIKVQEYKTYKLDGVVIQNGLD